MLKDDLEALTGRLIQGDVTPIVIDLLRSSKYKQDLLKYLNFCSDKELIHRVKEGCANANNKRTNTNTVKKNSSRPSLEEWISKSGVDVSL